MLSIWDRIIRDKSGKADPDPAWFPIIKQIKSYDTLEFQSVVPLCGQTVMDPVHDKVRVGITLSRDSKDAYSFL